jgi:hypothetical protein
MRNSKPDWLMKLIEDVREASLAFHGKKFPDAWLYTGKDEGSEHEDWYDWDEPLLGLPVYHTPAWVKHSGYDGEHQHIIPLWLGDVSNKKDMMREFECRLAKSGDFAQGKTLHNA